MVAHDKDKAVVNAHGENGAYYHIEDVEGIIYTNDAQPTSWKDEGSEIQRLKKELDELREWADKMRGEHTMVMMERVSASPLPYWVLRIFTSFSLTQVSAERVTLLSVRVKLPKLFHKKAKKDAVFLKKLQVFQNSVTTPYYSAKRPRCQRGIAKKR